MKKIAIFHPWIKSYGGAEKTVLEMMKNLKNAELYTWVYEKDNTFEEFKNFKVNLIGNKFFRKFSRAHILRGVFLLNCLFSKIPLERYDLFLISTSGVGEFIVFKNYKPGKTYAYVHTPLREADEEIMKWNLKNRHSNFISKLIYKIAVSLYKSFEKKAWKKIDFAIFNSELSRERAKKRGLIKNKKTEIVYPPIETEKLEKVKTKEGNYFLYPSRINPPKRQKLLIEAWKEFSIKHPNEKLIIAGGLENKNYYERLLLLIKDTPSIEIRVNLKEDERLKLYGECKAVIFVSFMEDFGIVPFEALVLGKPLIAVDKGGYVKLIEKIPQYYPIKEVSSEEGMIKEINKSLEKFLKSKSKSKNKGINLREIQNFKKNILQVFE